MLDVTTWAIVRGHEVFRDDVDPNLFWVLPERLELATGPEGSPQLDLIVFRGEGIGGGMLTATFRLATSEDDRRLVADDLRRMLGREVQVRAVEIEHVRVGLGPDDVTLGEGRPSPQGNLATSGQVAPELATAIERATEGAEPLPVRASIEVSGRRPSMDGTVTIDLDRARAHLAGLGDEPLDAAALRSAFGDMLEQRVIQLEAMSPSTRVIDAAQALLTDALLEPVGSQSWRLGAAQESQGSMMFGLAEPASVTTKRAWSEDLGALAGRGDDAPAVPAVDLEEDDFFATRDLKLEVLGDFAANEIHTVLVEVRAGDDMKTEAFSEPGTKTIRFRGRRPLVEMRTRVMTRSGGDEIGARGQRFSEWRPVAEEVVLLSIDELAPLWLVELRAEAVDWSAHPHVEVVARYGDDQRSFLMSADTTTATLRVRPADTSVRAVDLQMRYLGPGGQVLRNQTVEAPGTAVIGPP